MSFARTSISPVSPNGTWEGTPSPLAPSSKMLGGGALSSTASGAAGEMVVIFASGPFTPSIRAPNSTWAISSKVRLSAAFERMKSTGKLM